MAEDPEPPGPRRARPAVRRGGPTGLAVVDKEAGWTSHDVVAACRRIFGQRRVGHAGTLDPDATGVLVVGLGRATRLLRFVSVLAKTYTAEIVLGVATDTLDASGKVTGRWDMAAVGLTDVRRAAASLTGEIQQVPPMVSAVKVGGRRLHRLAREGLEVERPPRPVTVYRFDVEPAPEDGVYAVTVECTSGTYVRTLAADLGEALGGGAHLRKLRRTRVGSFGEREARTIGTIGVADLLSPAQAVRDLDTIVVGREATALVSRGLALDRVSLGATGDGPWALVDGRGWLLAIYEPTESDRIRPAVVLAAR